MQNSQRNIYLPQGEWIPYRELPSFDIATFFGRVTAAANRRRYRDDQNEQRSNRELLEPEPSDICCVATTRLFLSSASRGIVDDGNGSSGVEGVATAATAAVAAVANVVGRR